MVNLLFFNDSLVGNNLANGRLSFPADHNAGDSMTNEGSRLED